MAQAEVVPIPKENLPHFALLSGVDVDEIRFDAFTQESIDVFSTFGKLPLPKEQETNDLDEKGDSFVQGYLLLLVLNSLYDRCKCCRSCGISSTKRRFCSSKQK